MVVKKKICFIVNPCCSNRKQVEGWIRQSLDVDQYEYEVLLTLGPKHGTLLSQEAVSQNSDIVVAVGGDGTIHEVGQSLIGADTFFAIIPTGSGNGLARHLNIPMKPQLAIEVINRLRSQRMDTITINGKAMLNIAGVGFDARIAHTFSKGKRRGFLSYVQIVLIEYFSYHPKEFEGLIDGHPFKKKLFLMSFANGSQYGNRAVIAPKAQVNDGWIDVVFLRKFPLSAAPGILWRLFCQTLDQSPFTEIFRAKEVKVVGKSIRAHVDGEPLIFPHDMHLNLNPQSLKILIP